MNEKQITMSEIKIGDKIIQQDDTFREVSELRLSPSGKSIFFKYTGSNFEMRAGLNKKVFIVVG